MPNEQVALLKNVLEKEVLCLSRVCFLIASVCSYCALISILLVQLALNKAAAATAVALELSNKNAEEAKNLSDRNVQVQTQVPN